ncbi:hypothetical protein [Actinokineospora bangkokensis]|uniref:Uncharacterized protein n=1 Tax=Actinokineospora bangkokensis TaxID=1193682 RepID=A0A1Q9LKV6_9PSEU|nr:hypothetical protein [Actinokineospora bangkokensis]OLR92658.1 hypothetical protein BJP25_21740 [Actinokineospora bangkokensis]
MAKTKGRAAERAKRERNQRTAAARAAAAPTPAKQASGWQAALVVVGIIAWIALFPIFWYVIVPALDRAVGDVAAVNTIVGWLPGGLPMVAIGLYAAYQPEMTAEGKARWLAVCVVLGAIAAVTLPTFDTDPLNIGFIAGLRAGFLAVVLWLPAWFLVFLARYPFARKKELTPALRGWTIVVTSVVCLFLGASWIRYWF